MTAEQDKNAWDRQWRGNLLSTCLLHTDREEGQAVIEGWARFFSQLGKDARVLDIGTGNGFVPLLALDVSNRLGLDFDVHGSDYASINPLKAVPEQREALSQITFHPKTSNEKLPFPDKHFEAVTSQHALEYGDLVKSLTEIARVLKPGGRVRFLMHAEKGGIVQANLPKIAQCRHVLEKARLFDVTKSAVDDAMAGKGDDGQALREALSAVANKFKDDGNTKDLATLLGLLWGAFEARENFPNYEAFSTWLVENRLETEAQMLRIEAMAKAALSEKDAKTMTLLMQRAGFRELDLKEAKDPAAGVSTGWIFEAVRA